MPKLTREFPSCRFHKRSVQAIVVLDGMMHPLGGDGSAAGRAAYGRLIGEWMANGRRALPRRRPSS